MYLSLFFGLVRKELRMKLPLTAGPMDSSLRAKSVEFELFHLREKSRSDATRPRSLSRSSPHPPREFGHEAARSGATFQSVGVNLEGRMLVVPPFERKGGCRARSSGAVAKPPWTAAALLPLWDRAALLPGRERRLALDAPKAIRAGGAGRTTGGYRRSGAASRAGLGKAAAGLPQSKAYA